MLFYGAILGVIFTIPLLFVNSQKIFDDIRGIKPEIYITLNQIFIIKANKFLNLSDANQRTVFLNQLESDYKNKGFIPLPFAQAEIWTIPSRNRTKSCMIPFFERQNINRKFPVPIPHEEINDFCYECVNNLLYGINIGSKTIDYVTVKIEFADDIYVNKDLIGKDLEACGQHCILLKRNVLQNAEKFLGNFKIVKDESNAFDDTIIKQFKVTYKVWNEEFNLDNRYISKVISFVIPNCTSS